MPNDQRTRSSLTKIHVEGELFQPSLTLELVEPGDYSSLNERLPGIRATQVMLTMGFETTHSAMERKDILRGFLGKKDRIVVTEVGAERVSRPCLKISSRCVRRVAHSSAPASVSEQSDQRCRRGLVIWESIECLDQPSCFVRHLKRNFVPARKEDLPSRLACLAKCAC